MRIPIASIAGLGLLLAAAAQAEETYPDLVGTWSGQGEGVFVVTPGKQTDAQYRVVDITLEIVRQEGRRFNGTISMYHGTRPVVGVITDDGEIWWSEPSGFVEGRLTDPDTFRGCFMRVSTFSQLAACEVLKRQK